MEIAMSMGDVVGRLQRRWLANFAEAAEEWSAYVSALSRWEDDHLLEDPSPEVLAEHKATIERFLSFGRFLSLATDNQSFPERRTAETVAATQAVLRDKLRMWHSPRMDETQSDRILAACFSNEP